jgi:UDP-N-acetylmuramoyl-tripeptide--D-alanyl-D-alanine ligase
MAKLSSIKNLYNIFLKHTIISTDSRNIESNSLFFALKGQNFDGNKFANEAINKGAAFAIIDNPLFDISDKTILVDNVLSTLQNLANYHRKQLKIPFIAITGSNGKTTTKELVNAVLSKKYKTLATSGNLNNHIGVPLTILSITNNIEIAIIEMGANHQKEIALLCEIALPNYGIITNIGKAHLEGFGGIEGIKKGKGEMYDFIKLNNGLVFYNIDSQDLKEMVENKKVNTISYGTTAQANLQGNITKEQPTISFRWKWKDGQYNYVDTQLPGVYNLPNFLCAACVGSYFGVNENEINKALSEYISQNNRSQLIKMNNKTILLDAYNANPSSMEAAINNFEKFDAKRKVIFLGNMLELGKDAAFEHQKLINLLKEKRFQEVYLVGSLFKNVNTDFPLFEDVEQCIDAVKNKDFNNATILIKGSRGSKMEKLLDVL